MATSAKSLAGPILIIAVGLGWLVVSQFEIGQS